MFSKKSDIPPGKNNIEAWWDCRTCGTQFAQSSKYTPSYFNEIESIRYALEPYIHSFAQFTRYHGKKVLEVGVGAGTDFLQWARAGALAYGIDLAQESIEHARIRLEQEKLRAVELRKGDAEAIDFPSDFFDLVYSWGVIHHSPDTPKALGEIVRVTKPGGEIRVMIYNRHSITALMVWLRRCVLAGRPWHSLSYAIANYVESPGTKAYTRREAISLLASLPVDEIDVQSILTWCDMATNSRSRLLKAFHRMLCRIGGNRAGWFLLLKAKKKHT